MVISYPIPAYQNLPIREDFYQPRRFEIEDITLGETTLVTTVEDHDFVIGQLCRYIIPPQFGCRELNEKTGYVISIPAVNQLLLSNPSVGIDSFILADAASRPQILPVGNGNSGQINAEGRRNNKTFIPGSFINISP